MMVVKAIIKDPTNDYRLPERRANLQEKYYLKKAIIFIW